MRHAGVAVARAGFAVPGDEARHEPRPAEDHDLLLAPADAVAQGREQLVRLPRGERSRQVADVGVGEFEAAGCPGQGGAPRQSIWTAVPLTLTMSIVPLPTVS